MSKKDSSLDTTKQMLDELDALMERMLSLPVNEVDDAAALPKLTATLTLPLPEPVKAPPPSVKPATVQYYTAPEAPPTLGHPSLNPPHLAPAAEAPPAVPTPQPEPLNNDVVPPSLVAKLAPLLAQMQRAEAAPPAPWGHGPLVWVNQAFDHSTLALGGAGGFLRSHAGRMMLGLSGVAFLLVAAGWFLKDWLGWNW